MGLNATRLLSVSGAFLILQGCGMAPPSAPSDRNAGATFGPSGDWTTVVEADCTSPQKRICRVDARMTSSELELRVVTNDDIFSGLATGATVTLYIDADQDPNTVGFQVNDIGPETDRCFSPDPDFCDVRPPGTTTFAGTFPLEFLYRFMPASHRGVDLVFRSRDRTSGAVQNVPASGHVTYRLR